MTRLIPALLTTLAVGLLVTSAGASAASAVGGINDTRTSITVDCLIGEGSNDNQLILPGEILTVTLLNCDGWAVKDLDERTTLRNPSNVQSNRWTVVGSPAIFTVTGAADVDLDPPTTNPGTILDIDIDVSVATPATAPSGTLNLTTRVTMPVEINDFEIAVPVGAADGSGPDTLLADRPACEMEQGYHPYQTLPITIATAGDFTFRVIDVTPVDEDLQWGQPYLPSQDLFLSVYTAFDADNPEADLVDCADDRAEDDIFVVNGGVTYLSDDQTPEFIAALEPGDYTLVLTTNRSTSSSEWAAGRFSPWSGVSETEWTPQPMSGLFELWGPEGSIAAVVPEVTAPEDATPEDAAPELAATGAVDAAALAGVAGLGLLVVAAGATVVVTRRRITRA